MRFSLRRLPAALLALIPLLLPGPAGAQPPPRLPHLAFVYPAGAEQGTIAEIRIGGQNLQGASAVCVSGSGIRAVVTDYYSPPSAKEQFDLPKKLRDAVADLTRKGVKVPSPQGQILASPIIVDVAQLMGISTAKLRGYLEWIEAGRNPKHQPNGQLQEWIAVHVSVDPGAAVGDRELRVASSLGLSNPIRFQIGRYSEMLQSAQADGSPADVASLPVVLNGQILPGEAHRYSFTGRKGMRFVAAISAESLMPYLADAVPGWFQPRISLFGPDGREIASADHFQFRVDPILHCDLPADGKYIIEVRDTLYRGREDFVYRLTMGELPVVTSVFPLGGRSTGVTTVQTRGWNLEQAEKPLEGGTLGAGVHTIELGGIDSEDYRFQIDGLPECDERPSEAAQRRSQAISLPVAVNGCIRKPGEVDAYRFNAKAGQNIVAEVMARRLGSQLDSTLSLTDSTGKEIAFNDDFEDKAYGLLTHQADSRITATVPKTGTYVVRIRDAASRGGDEYGYRLRVGPPMPDFDLRIVPSSITLRAGTTSLVTVSAIRRDGFDGEIDLKLSDSPDGFLLRGARILPGRDSVAATLTAPAAKLAAPAPIRIEGRAVIGGHELVHAVVPAEDMMQAFAYRHIVPAQELVVDTLPRGTATPMPAVDDASPLRLVSGGVTTLRLTGFRGASAAQIQIAITDAPAGISIKSVTPDDQGIVVAIRADTAKIKPGSKGAIILSAFRDTMAPSKPGSTTLVKHRLPMGLLPAVPFDAVGQ